MTESTNLRALRAILARLDDRRDDELIDANIIEWAAREGISLEANLSVAAAREQLLLAADTGR